MFEGEMDNIETENHKSRDKQRTLENDNEVENIHKDDMCNKNLIEFTSNLHESQDNNESLNLVEQLENILNQQTNEMDSTSHTELLNFEDMSSESENLVDNYYSRVLDIETETSKKSSDVTSLGFESINSEMTYITPKSINKEIYNSQLIVLEPNNPVMVRFQKTLKLHLLKQRENIKKELQTLDGSIKSKQKEKSSFINEINNVACRVETQHRLLNEFHRMKLELKTTKERVEECIEQRKQLYTEMHTKTTIESKKFSALKRQLDFSRGLLKELIKYEKEQEITFNVYNQKKSEAKQYKKKLLNDQQKQDLLLLSLTQEILRLEDRMKQLGEQAETKFNEREVLRQKVINNSIDLDAINEDNAKITLLWNDVLISIQQCDKCFMRTKDDFQEAKNKYHTLLMEANSYKRSAKEEFHKNKDLLNYLNKLKREQNNLQNNFKTSLDKFNCLKEEYSKLLQMTEFQHQNLDQITLEQISIKNETNALLHFLNKVSNQKLKHEEDILNEIKKQLFSNNFCVQINNKISEINVQNKEHELLLVEVENNLSKALLKLEQCRTTSSNLEQDIEENTKYLNDQGFALTTLDSELKKIYSEIQNKTKQIDLENKQLEIVKKLHDDGCILTPKMQIEKVRNKIDEVVKETNSIKQSWIQQQNKNVQLLAQLNNQFNELVKVRKYDLVMETKNKKLEKEIASLSKEVYQYKQTLTNMRNTILKLNEQFSQNKGKSNMLLNENEWIQCSYLAELKENEKLCLEFIDQLKLLKNELNELKNVYVEKQCESKSWDTKLQLLIEIKKEIKNKEGDLGDIDIMKNEIHRMQIRESQLKKILEKIMLDLEVCISRRETIYNKVAAKDIRLKGKNEAKQKFLKKLDYLRINIKKIKTECKKLDSNISDLKNNKIKLENKLTYLNDNMMNIQKSINDILRNIEDIGATKIKNIHILSYKQNYGKFLDTVKKGNYRLLIKNELKMKDEFSDEWKKNSDLISVVEALKNDFPYLDFQIARLLYILKSIDNKS
ncbi:hypothetical protein AGLY_002743 [Aphis glycines]|uniref:Coiled-coil domain-containing protein 40 n=1 Tax=Aphis glycines TaxID=307491 RepID=A0A6G0U3H7_APHGL|nr:hypothetical protein AGLY_002743 [Aphis glycines]